MQLFTPDFGLVFWMFVGFGVLFFILWRFAWPVILKTVDNRAALIDKGVEYAQNAKQQLDQANRTSEGMLQQTRDKQAEMLREADRLKTQIVEDARKEAQKEAQKVMDAAKVSIAQQQKEAEQQLRSQVGQMALNIAQKVVKNHIADPKAQSQLVNSYLDDIENTDSKAKLN